MQALRFVTIFAAVAIIVTIAALTAAFMVWSVIPVQPGTATALFTLFILAPGAGIATGLYMAARSMRRPTAMAMPGDRNGRHGAAIALALVVALAGFLAGYGGTMAGIDLTYADRWTNPASAPVWLPYAPPAAGILLALVLAMLVLAGRNRRAGG
jgi:hypothetical protein